MKIIRILREGYEKVGILGGLRKKAGIPKTRSTSPPIPKIRKDRPLTVITRVNILKTLEYQKSYSLGD